MSLNRCFNLPNLRRPTATHASRRKLPLPIRLENIDVLGAAVGEVGSYKKHSSAGTPTVQSSGWGMVYKVVYITIVK